MKLALTFLVALVAITQQQLQRTRGMLWVTLNSPRPAGNYYQPIYHNDIKENIPFPRYFSPTMPFIASTNEVLNSDPMSLLESRQNNQEGSYQSRNKGEGQHQQSDARYFYFSNNNSNNVNNPFFKTTTFTIISTVTVASVQSCVPSNQLSTYPLPSCRKKRELSDSTTEDVQFFISPSKTLPLTATASPSFPQMRTHRQLPMDEMATYGIRSSKLDEAPGEVSRIFQEQKTKEKRFFIRPNANRFMVSTTVTSYLFVNTVITKIVRLGIVNDAVIGTKGSVQCLPLGYNVCDPVAAQRQQ